MRWYFDALSKYAVFRGRARRKEFCYFMLFNSLILVGLGTIDGLVRAQSPQYPDRPLTLLYALAVAIPTWAVATRRLHDTNRSAWSLLLSLIPLVNLYFLVGLFVRRGHAGPSQYGPDPRVDTNFGRSMQVAAPGTDLTKLAGPGETPPPQSLADSTGKALAVTATPGLAIPVQAAAGAQSAAGQEVQTAQPKPSTPFGVGLGGSNAAGGVSTPSAHNQLTAVALGCQAGAVGLQGTGGDPGPGPEPRAGDTLAHEKPLLSKATSGTGAAGAREPLDAQHGLAPRQGQASAARTAVVVLAGVICVTLGLTVWPTIYRHDHANGLPIRTNRITGVAQFFTTYRGWTNVVSVSTAREINLSDLLANAHANAEWDSDTVSIRLQNSTDYYITEIVAEITVKDDAGNVLSDETYRAAPDPGTGSCVPPGTSGYFNIYTGINTGDFPGGTWSLSLVGARGVKD